MQLEKEFYPKILDMTLFMVTYWNIGYVTEDKSDYGLLCTEYVGYHIYFSDIINVSKMQRVDGT